MSDLASMVPTQEDFEFIERILDGQDMLERFGTCEDYMDDEGYCRMCTARQRLNSLITFMKDEDAWIGTK